MKITWIGHSCFRIEEGGYSIVIDPYDDNYVPGLKPVRERAQAVFASHEHGDHNARNRVTLVPGASSPFTVTKIETYHDPEHGALRGRNTIHVFSAGGRRIAHFGDLGCELEKDQLEQLKGLDAALIPVGGFYTIDAAQAADLIARIQPTHVIPMHFRAENNRFGFDKIGTVSQFTDLMESVIYTGGSALDPDNAPEEQVVVLTPKNVILK